MPTQTNRSDLSQLAPALAQRIQMRANTGTAKNVILFIGDGMGVSTVTAARIFDGQSQGGPGEDHALAFETFPYVALVKTYNTNQQVADSAGTASAMHTGTKTRAGVISIGPEVERQDCLGARGHELDTLAEIAERQGKATGIVTTARVTHATPATLYAHSPERDWESDRYIPAALLDRGCRDIAYQLTHFSAGDGLDVVLGGGRRMFYGNTQRGQRRSNEDDLVADWLAAGKERRYLRNRNDLQAAQAGEQVLGLFANSHLRYIADRRPDSEQPSLSEMTAKAIELLSDSDSGYFLMVEGGRIDHGHHDGKAGYALLEAQEFNRAIAATLGSVDLDDTLIMVTADHSHTLSFAGYPTRGNPILGLVMGNDRRGNPNSSPSLAADGLPYSSLAYINGPGAVTVGERGMPDTGVNALQQALVATASTNIDGSTTVSETHGGEDVALYATGPWAHLVGGVMEQNLIFDVIEYAFGWQAQR